MKLGIRSSSVALAAMILSGQALAQAPAGAPPPTPPPPAPAAAEPEQPAAPPPGASEPAAPLPAPAAPPPPPLLVGPPPAAQQPVAPPQTYPQVDEAPEPDDGTLGSHQEHLFLGAGMRTSFIADEGFDPFSEDDALPQFSLHAGGVLMTSGAASLVALGGWDYGQTQSSARVATTELDVHRVWLAAEGRYHLLRRLYGFGRLAPALLHTSASLRDNVAQAERVSNSLLFGADVSLGAACELFGHRSGGVRAARGWLTLAGGYGFTTSSELLLEVKDDGGAPVRTAALDLGELALGGPFMRIDFALSF